MFIAPFSRPCSPAKPAEKLSGRPDTGPPPVPPVPSPPHRCNSEPQRNRMKQELHTQIRAFQLRFKLQNYPKCHVPGCSWYFMYLLYRISTKFFDCSTRSGSIVGVVPHAVTSLPRCGTTPTACSGPSISVSAMKPSSSEEQWTKFVCYHLTSYVHTPVSNMYV